MNQPDPARGLAISYRCSICSRSFVALGSVELEEGSSRELVCGCGAPLTSCALPTGLHELGLAVPRPTAKPSPVRGQIPKEPDRGYGASHGYDVTHGGPTGPGDAPASVPDKTA